MSAAVRDRADDAADQEGRLAGGDPGITPASVLLVCMPYMERRAFATARKLWPEVEVVCVSAPVGLRDYARGIGDAWFVVAMMVADPQRVLEYPRLGFAIGQEVPPRVRRTYEFLVAAGFDSHLIPDGRGPV